MLCIPLQNPAHKGVSTTEKTWRLKSRVGSKLTHILRIDPKENIRAKEVGEDQQKYEGEQWSERGRKWDGGTSELLQKMVKERPKWKSLCLKSLFISCSTFVYLFGVLRHLQQPGSYCDGQFTGGGNQCILHCKPLGIGKWLPTFKHEAPGLRFELAASAVGGENSNHYTTEPFPLCYRRNKEDR